MKWLKRIGIGLAALIALLVVFLALKHEKRPQGGENGDELARKIQAAVRTDAWNNIGAVHFNYGGRHTILWDRSRGFARVDWGSKRAIYRIGEITGRAYEGGVEVTGEAAKKIVEEGHKWFINDSFWLNPFPNMFDPNVTRTLATDADGRQGLLVTYGSGGVTPGDSYLWFTNSEGMPSEWKMWVSIIPVGGLSSTWEKWVELPGGAKISTEHKAFGLTFGVTDLKAGATLAEIEPGADPFAVLSGGEQPPAVAASQAN